jgi:hypothetical protein
MKLLGFGLAVAVLALARNGGADLEECREVLFLGSV